MQSVGIRELKANLSRYLSMVKQGQRIVVTDRKKQVAIISPFDKESNEEKLLQLIQRGIADWSGGKPVGMRTKIVSTGKNVSDAVLEGRR